MAQVRYTGSNRLIAGLVGVVVEESRHLNLSGGECVLVEFGSDRLPLLGRRWNLNAHDLESVA